MKIKIRDSKGKLHVVCPYLDRITELTQKLTEKSSKRERLMIAFDIGMATCAIREIAKAWQGESCIETEGKAPQEIQKQIDESSIVEKIDMPYNFSSVIAGIRLAILSDRLTIKRLEDLLLTYMQ